MSSTPARAKWRASELKESAASHEHFIDLCRLLDEPTPAEADPAGETYCFERARARTPAAKDGPMSGNATASPGNTRDSGPISTPPSTNSGNLEGRVCYEHRAARKKKLDIWSGWPFGYHRSRAEVCRDGAPGRPAPSGSCVAARHPRRQEELPRASLEILPYCLTGQDGSGRNEN